MIEANLDFSDLIKLSDDLKALSKAESNQVLRKATSAGANVLKKQIVNNAPVSSGNLKKSIYVSTKASSSGFVTSSVDIRGRKRPNKNKKPDGKSYPFYWRFVELGTSRMPPTPFIRPAYAAKEKEATELILSVFNKALDEALKK